MGQAGDTMSGYRAFRPPQSVRDYGYVDGDLVVEPRSPSGYLLPWIAVDDQTDAVRERRAPAYVVIGEFIRDDGMRAPDLAVTTGHIEATTDYRWDPASRSLRLICPACGVKDGKHAKLCDLA